MTDTTLLLLAGSLSGIAAPTYTNDDVRTAVTKSITRLEASRDEYTSLRTCFSCHHQGVPALALSLAKARGFAIDADNWQSQRDLTVAFVQRDRERYTSGRGPGGQVDSAGSILFTLELAEFDDPKATDPVVDYLLKRDKERGHWRAGGTGRPPSQGSPFSATYFALRGLKTFAKGDAKAKADERIAAAKEWLIKTPAKDTEDRAFRLMALRLVGADTKAATDELARTQRGDGGWAQLESMKSDAYATGQAMVALGGSNRRGAAFLLRTQLDDGSWHVATRAKGFQPYFESGYPHGKDQFISMAAAGWATAALANEAKKD